MRSTLLSLLAAAAVSAAPGGPKPKPDEDGRYTITADGIKAQVNLLSTSHMESC